MAILLTKSTKVVVQGITGREGSMRAKFMRRLGTNVVAGVTPGRGGEEVDGIPVYNTVKDAVKNHGLFDVSVTFIPGTGLKDAVFEALDSGIKKIVVTAEGIPVHDALQMRKAALSLGAMVIGGNTTGVVTPGQAMMGFIPYWIERVYKPGKLGVMTRSGSLTNEATAMAVRAGFGVSTLIGVGCDTVPMTRFAEVLPLFEKDTETEAVLVIGEIGGTMEEEVAEAIEQKIFTKPLIAFIAGRTAPAGKKMGHAGAIVTGGRGTVAAKTEALIKAGAFVAQRPSLIGEALRQAMSARMVESKVC